MRLSAFALASTLSLLTSAPLAAQAPTHAGDARSQGPTHAPVTVYEMADFQCPACRQFATLILPEIERDFIQTGKIRWVFVNLPLIHMHKNTIAAAEVAMCASRQGRFWPMHDLLYRHQDDWAPLDDPRTYLEGLGDSLHLQRGPFLSCLAQHATRAEIDADAASSARSGATATPSFYIEGGLLEGAAPYPAFKQLLDSVYAAKTASAGH